MSRAVLVPWTAACVMGLLLGVHFRFDRESYGLSSVIQFNKHKTMALGGSFFFNSI
jgi:hypothetical protein